MSLVWIVSMVLFLILMAINLATLLYASVVLIIPQLSAGSLQAWPIFTIFPELSVVFYITGTVQVLVYFLLIFAVIVFAFVHFSLADGKGILRLMALPLSSSAPRLRSRNHWSMVAQLFLATLFFQYAYIALLSSMGVEINAPPGIEDAPWLTLFELANASVYEELVSRVLLIGVPMFIASLALRMGKVRSAGHLSSRKASRDYLLGSFRYLWGGNVSRKSSKATLVMALVLTTFSAIVFGAAHQGWGAWKLLPAFVAGLALGYAFLRGGLLAAVLLHFATDYLAATALVVESDVALVGFLEVLLIALLILGACFFLYYCIYVLSLFTEVFSRGRVPAPATFQGATSIPPVLQGQSGTEQSQPGYGMHQPSYPFGTLCPYCGWPEAVYSDGRFKCSNCGKLR